MVRFHRGILLYGVLSVHSLPIVGLFFSPGKKNSRVTNESYVMPNFDGNSISLSSRLEKKMAQLKKTQAVQVNFRLHEK
jgi:hypothetical protein